jgi:competence protein ComEA
MTQFKKLVTVLLLVVVSFIMVTGGGLQAAANAEGKDTGSSSAKININTAGSEQLRKLPRIGEKMSQRVIDYREKNGKFKRIEDIMKVKGIGEKTFEGFKDMITVGTVSGKS